MLELRDGAGEEVAELLEPAEPFKFDPVALFPEEEEEDASGDEAEAVTDDEEPGKPVVEVETMLGEAMASGDADSTETRGTGSISSTVMGLVPSTLVEAEEDDGIWETSMLDEDASGG